MSLISGGPDRPKCDISESLKLRASESEAAAERLR